MSQGLVARIAHWTSTHRRFTVLAWLSALVVALAVSGAAGSHYSNNNSLKGTESQRATDLLARSFPSQAGDADQIVLHVRQGRVTDPAVRARVNPVLSRVARLPHVTGVVSPFGPQSVSRAAGLPRKA